MNKICGLFVVFVVFMSSGCATTKTTSQSIEPGSVVTRYDHELGKNGELLANKKFVMNYTTQQKTTNDTAIHNKLVNAVNQFNATESGKNEADLFINVYYSTKIEKFDNETVIKEPITHKIFNSKEHGLRMERKPSLGYYSIETPGINPENSKNLLTGTDQLVVNSMREMNKSLSQDLIRIKQRREIYSHLMRVEIWEKNSNTTQRIVYKGSVEIHSSEGRQIYAEKMIDRLFNSFPGDNSFVVVTNNDAERI